MNFYYKTLGRSVFTKQQSQLLQMRKSWLYYFSLFFIYQS